MANDSNTSDDSYSESNSEDDETYSSSESEEYLNERSPSTPVVWVGNGTKQHAVILFRPDSIITNEKKLKNIGEKYHLAFKMVKTESKLVRSILSAYGFHEVHPNCPDFNLMWTGAHLKPFSLRTLSEFQRVNHFPRSYEITRKDRIYKNIDRMAHSKGMKHFDFIPKSYLMPSEYQDFCSAYVKEKGQWIVKPIASSRGRGIYLINNPNQVPLEDNIMVCRYIHNPLLIDGFKFDVRVYVAVTSYDPLLIYLFEEGLTRFATVKYEKANRHLKNQMMHLTNYSINKKSHDYVRCDDPDIEDYGNKWSMSAMLRYLKQEGVDTTLLMARIEAVIIKSIIAAELPIATACRMFVPYRDNCIELYGFDILIDENLKPWLLEGNLSPSLACDAPLDLKIKSSVVADFFSLAGFQCVDPVAKRQGQKNGMKRPFSAIKSNTSINGNGSKRPNSAVSKENFGNKSGLSQEDVRVLRFVKEQYQRRGGFVRIFPTKDTWDQYSCFLEYKTSLNQLLAQRLFAPNPKSSTGPYLNAVSRLRTISTGHQLIERNQVISKHCLQYERKLLALDPKRRKKVTTKKVSSKARDTPVGIDIKSRSFSRQSSSTGIIESSSADINYDSDSVGIVQANQKTKNKLSSGISKSSLNEGKSRSKTSIKSNGSKASSGSDNINTKKPTHKSSVPATEITELENPVDKSIRNKNGSFKNTVSKNLYVEKNKGDVPTTQKASQHRVYTYKTTQQAPSTKPPIPDQQVETPDNEKVLVGKSDQDKLLKPSAPVQVTESKKNSQVATNAAPIKKQESILDQLKSGANLSKIQARNAFSAYLSRVQYRLMYESDGSFKCSADVIAKQEEQMDLVLRFLKRAAGNLKQSFNVVVPSLKLQINDRKRILAKQLGDFVQIYNKETENMLHHQQLDLDLNDKNNSKQKNYLVCVTEFKNFVLSATETELEEILTTYTHKNKSASVFLGASKSSKSSQGGTLETKEKLQSPYLSSDRYTSYSAHRSCPSKQDSINSQTKAESINKDESYEYVSVFNDKNNKNLHPYAVSSKNSTNVNFYHGQTITNEEAITEALQRLSERQAARKYNASSHLNSLSQHLNTLNLANMTKNANQKHIKASTVQQRASSLPDLAKADPGVQSMIDPAVRDINLNTAHNYISNQRLQSPNNRVALIKKGNEKNHSQISHSQMLAQQSRELQQQNKAKHLAMLAAQVHTNNINGKQGYMPYFHQNQKMRSLGLPPASNNWGDNRAFVLRKTMGSMRRPNTATSPTSQYSGISVSNKDEKSILRNRTYNINRKPIGAPSSFKKSYVAYKR